VLFKPPYQYVVDTSALIDLKNQYPESVFPGLWERFNEMCDQKKIVSPREVLREIKKGDDDLLEWSEKYPEIFLEPTEEEIEILQEILASYSQNAIGKFSTGPWADPFVIACAKHYQIPIIQQELNDLKQYKLPAVAKLHGITCLHLVKFFADEGWTFVK